MTRSAKALCLVSTFLVLVAAAAATHIPKANTRAAITSYVQQAAQLVQKQGGAACTAFASSQWQSGDYYIFVIGPDGKLICHPNKALIGKPQSTIANAHGEKVGEKILQAGMGSSMGWVEYFWARPGKTAEEPKSTYVMGVTGPDGKHYTVGAGAWNVK